jgi:hypothetical protein
VSSQSSASIGQASSKAPAQATVTGVDCQGQLFRDAAQVIFLKDKKCMYLSKIKPSPDNSLLIEMPNGRESWRSDAAIRAVTRSLRDRSYFRVTLELERASSVVIETPEADEESAPPAPVAAPIPAPKVSVFASPVASTTPSLSTPKPFAPLPSFPQNKDSVPAGPTPAAKAAVNDVVRSIVVSEMEQWKREIQALIAGQIETVIEERLQALEARIEQQLNQLPVITAEAVQAMIADTIHAAIAAHGPQRR